MERMIISWTTIARSDISEEMIECIQNRIFNASFAWPLPLFSHFFSKNAVQKLGWVLYTGTHY